jgi:hypothetical protein
LGIECSIEDFNQGVSDGLIIDGDLGGILSGDHRSDIFRIILIRRIPCDRVRKAHGNRFVPSKIIHYGISNRLTDIPKIDTGGEQIDTSNIVRIEIPKKRIGTILDDHRHIA